MLASSSTFERPRVSPRSSHGFPKRQSPSPLSNNHTVGTFISPSMDSLIQDSSQPKPSRPRRKGLSWNPWRHAGRNSAISSTGLIPSPGEIEKAEGNRTKPLKTPWHHGWRTALFGTCMPPIPLRFNYPLTRTRFQRPSSVNTGLRRPPLHRRELGIHRLSLCVLHHRPLLQ